MRLLFSDYFSWDIVLKLSKTAHYFKKFMTKEQTCGISAIQQQQLHIRNGLDRQRLFLDNAHNKTIKLYFNNDNEQCRCSICYCRVKPRNLSKHQRYCAWKKNIQNAHDVCKECGWILPHCDRSHDKGCPKKMKICLYCGIYLNPGCSHHICSIDLNKCRACGKLIPQHLLTHGIHKEFCMKTCAKFVNGKKCVRSVASKKEKFCRWHLGPWCSAITKTTKTSCRVPVQKEGQRCKKHQK